LQWFRYCFTVRVNTASMSRQYFTNSIRYYRIHEHPSLDDAFRNYRGAESRAVVRFYYFDYGFPRGCNVHRCLKRNTSSVGSHVEGRMEEGLRRCLTRRERRKKHCENFECSDGRGIDRKQAGGERWENHWIDRSLGLPAQSVRGHEHGEA